MFGFLRRSAPTTAEARSDVVQVSDTSQMMSVFNMMETASGEPVTIETALGVPSVFAAVNFLAGTLASLPLQLYQRDAAGRSKKLTNDLSRILNGAVNDEWSSFDWRKYSFEQTFTGGRQFTFIERNAAGRIIALWPLEPGRMTIRRRDRTTVYDYRDGSRPVTYEASEIIDLPFMRKADGLAHRSPIMANSEVISMAIAATKFGAAYFRGGGIPPYAVTGGFQSGKSMRAAADDLEAAVKKAVKEKRQAVVLPKGLEIKSIGTDAEKAQMIETQRFLVEQIARIYALPPVFLQDLSHGTYSNAEQQDLHLVKHTVSHWVSQFEGEVNLKLFGRGRRDQFVRLNLDGLLRGDFKTRMEGYAQGIQNGVLTPNEARELDDRTGMEGGDRLFMQGAMMPIANLGADQNQGGTNA